MKAYIKTVGCTYVDEITTAYPCTFQGQEGVVLVPVNGDDYFIKTDLESANNICDELFLNDKIDLREHTAQLIDDTNDWSELYEDSFEYDLSYE
jgi:hypothetical protein